MRNKRCCYPKCRNDTRYPDRPSMRDTFFIPFPKPIRHLEKCKRWLKACGLNKKIEKINCHVYLCSKHFVGSRGPSFEHPDPIPINTELTLLNQGPLTIEDPASNGSAVTDNSSLSNTQLPSGNKCTGLVPCFLDVNLTVDNSSTLQNVDLINSEVKPDILDILEMSEIVSSTIMEESTSSYIQQQPVIEDAAIVLDVEHTMTNEQLAEITFPSSESCIITRDVGTSPLQKSVKKTRIIKRLENLCLDSYPQGWSCCIFKDVGEICFNKQFSSASIPLVSIVININGTFSITIIGRKVPSENRIFDVLPRTIETKKDLRTIVEHLDKQGICQGNPEERFALYARKSQSYGYFNWRTSAMHSSGCLLFLRRKEGVKRCGKCDLFRQILTMWGFRKTNKLRGGESSLRTVSIMNKSELRKCVRTTHKKLRRLEDQNNYMRKKISAIASMI